MVNPYALGSRNLAPKKQINLGQSSALKKFEKLQAKHTERQSGSFGKGRKSINSLNSSNDNNEDEEDDDDDDSVFKNATKNANKFIKNKAKEQPVQTKRFQKVYDEEDENEVTESQPSELEISVVDRSSTPVAVKRHSIQSGNRPSSRLVSGTSSVSSIKSTNKRSQSKVKFMKTDMNEAISDRDNEDEQSSIVEELFNKNLVLDIDELEASVSQPKPTKSRKFLKSPLSTHKRSESVASIVEENEEEYSSLTPSRSSPSLLETNLILDIGELEQNAAKLEERSRRESKQNEDSSYSEREKHKKKDRKKKEDSTESEMSEKKSKKKDKKKKDKKEKEKEKEKKKSSKSKHKRSRSRTSTIVSNIASDTDTIATEIMSEINYKSYSETEEIKTLRSQSSSSRSPTRSTSRTSRSESRTPRNSSRTGKSTDRSTSRTSVSKLDLSKTETKTQHKSTRSYYDDFETEGDLTSRRNDASEGRRKQLSFADKFDMSSRQTQTKSNAEVQVDTVDLSKYSNLLKSVNVYNPSSLLLASVSHFDDSSTLRDLNQLTGYNMINQTFNDLIKMNLNFMKNFLSAQRNLYEQQVYSIQPK